MDLDTLHAVRDVTLAADTTGVNNAIRGGFIWILIPALGLMAALAAIAGSGKWVGRFLGGAALGLLFVFASATTWTAIGGWLGGIADGIRTLSP